MRDEGRGARDEGNPILRRLPDSRFSEVAPLWTGETAVIIGGGPSLSFADVELAHWAHKDTRVRCIAINDSYLWAPWSDVCYFADSRFWAWHTAGIDKPVLGLSKDQVRQRFEDFAGQKCSVMWSGSNITDEGVHILRNKHFPHHGDGLSEDSQMLATGRNSGWQAINLAVLAGAKRLLLLGFDGREAQSGATHWHGGHPLPTPQEFYQAMRRAFSLGEAPLKAAGVTVLNCSPGSGLDNFTKMDLKTALGAAC